MTAGARKEKGTFRKALESSAAFHRETESLAAFCNREWLPLLFFGLTFSLVLVAIILLVDESFFYSRIQTDALWYYLKGKTFAETAHATALVAINRPPVVFPSMPGILRAPIIRVLGGFDAQLRAIQLMNVVIMDAVAVLSAYIASWAIPRRWHWAAIGFSFAFSLIAPWWMQNVFLPLTDAPYAALSLSSILIVVAIMRAQRPSTEIGLGIAFAVAAAAAFLFRFTEPAVLILAAGLIWGRIGRIPKSPRLIAVVVGAVAAFGLLIAFNHDAIFVKYVTEFQFFVLVGEKQSMVLNVICLAIPQQIIPAFDLGFSHPPILGLNRGEFAGTPGDAAWSVLGLLISAVVVAGMWRSRRRFAPEILMILAVLPVLMLMMPSTPRYLMTYQAFFWIWFYEGCRFVAELVPARRRQASKTVALAGAAATLMVGLGLGLAHRGFLKGGKSALSPPSIAGYVKGETETYRPLSRFMATLPHDRAILVTIPSTTGRWKAISGLDYYYPDSAIARTAALREMYLVLDCGSPVMCETMSRDESRIKKILARYGAFSYEPVFEASAAKSRAHVFRIRPGGDSTAQIVENEKGNPLRIASPRKLRMRPLGIEPRTY